MEAELFISSLGFLKVNPAEDWYDFLVTPEKLVDFFGKSVLPGEPSVHTALSQFAERANQEEKEIFQEEQAKISSKEDTEIEEIQEQIIHRNNKCSQLRMLASACFAELKWNLKAISASMTLYTCKSLLDRILWWSVNLEFPEPPEMILSQFERSELFGAPQDCSVFLLLLYCRWCLLTDVEERFPSAPPKYTVSNPVMQTDPGQLLLDEKRVVLDTVRKMSETAVTILERWISQKRKGCLNVPSVNAFLDRSDERVRLKPDFGLEKMRLVSAEFMTVQIRYELLAYRFSRKQYGEAKEHLRNLLFLSKNFPFHSSEWSVDSGKVDGYCAALAVKRDVQAPELRKSHRHHDLVVLSEGITEQNMMVLREDVGRRCLSLILRKNVEDLSKSIRRFSGSERTWIAGSGVVRRMQEFLSVSRRCLQFLGRRENIPVFCQTILAHINQLGSSSDAGALAVYLKLICSVEPEVEKHLVKSGVKMALGSYSEEFLNMSKTRKHHESDSVTPEQDCVTRLANGGDPLWCLTRTFDAVELKQLLPNLQPFRLPIRFRVPSTLDHLCNRLPHGYMQDIIGLYCSKTDQIASVGNLEKAQVLIQACMLELGPPANDPVVHAAFNCEGLKMELESWHRILHKIADVRQVGQMTQNLVPKVKGYVGALERISRGASTSTEMGALTAAFLLNSCDWEYYLKTEINPNDRVMNLAKMLAAMCHELSQGNVNALKLCTRTFFDLLLPTVENQGSQMKRKAGGDKQQVHRQFVTRQQLATLLLLIKEQRATSLLIGYFGKLFNVMNGGMTQIFTEHSDLWPSTYTESCTLNEDFVREMLGECVRNGLLINPNNAFCLRTQADMLVTMGEYYNAMQFYAQTLIACSDYFFKSLPENVTNDDMYRNMIKCCSKLHFHTQEALLAQFLSDTKEGFAIAVKALEESNSFDAHDSYYQFIWQMNFFELFICVLSKRGDYLKVEICRKHLGVADFNCHNRIDISDQTVLKRKFRFLRSLCHHYICLR